MTSLQTKTHGDMPNDLVNDQVSDNGTETHNEYSTQDDNVVDDVKSSDDEVNDNMENRYNAQEPENAAGVEEALSEEMSSPGAHLRNVREKGKMSVKHVADKLFLDTRVIESLEADEYGELPPTIFVRGYLRNYAKLMEVPSQPVLETFAKNTITKPDQKLSYLSPHHKRNEPASSQDLWPTIGTFIVVITLIILAVLWQFYPMTPTVVPQSPVNNSENDDSWPSPELYQPVVEPTAPPTVANPETHEVTSEPSQSPAADTATKPNNGSETVPAPLPEGQQTMQVRFKNRVWMRISDAKGKKLYNGIGKSGKAAEVNGFPPFKVNVGNTGVEIEYAGSIKNIKEYPKQKGKRRTFIIGTKGSE